MDCLPLRLFVFLLLFLSSSLPVMAQSDSEAPSPYIVGQVTEILSEKTLIDKAFQHQEKRIKFKVELELPEGEENNVILEQTYSADTPKTFTPIPGRKYIFFQESLIDGSTNYTLIDVKPTDHVGLFMAGISVLLILVGRWYGIKAILLLGCLMGSVWGLTSLQLPFFLSYLTAVGVMLVLGSSLLFHLHDFKARLIAVLLSGLLSLGMTGLYIWIAGLLNLSDTSSLLQGVIWIQMAGGLLAIILSVISTIQVQFRNEPGLPVSKIYQNGLQKGREMLEWATLISGSILMGQLFQKLSVSEPLSVMQMEPLYTELILYGFMILGFLTALPLSAFLGVKTLSPSQPRSREV